MQGTPHGPTCLSVLVDRRSPFAPAPLPYPSPGQRLVTGDGGVNILKPHLRTTVETLLSRGMGQRQIAKVTGVNRRTIRAISKARQGSAIPDGGAIQTAPPAGVATGSECEANQTAPPSVRVATGSAEDAAQTAPPSEVAAGSGDESTQTAPPRPPAKPKQIESQCEPFRTFIEEEVGKGRNAKAIYQELVDQQGFTHAYNSVKRFVGKLRAREPERFDVLEFLPGEESQVDYGLGAPTRRPDGKYKRPYLFVMTLRYSRKSFRKCVWKTNKETWARLHEEGWRSFGGSTQYDVLDNLKEGVITPDLYEPELNPIFAAMLKHYGVVADPCRVRDPNRKGTVESAIKHTQNTALKGKKFESIEEQNEHLADWEERWASTRVHGREKRQVMEMFLEERPYLQPLPLEKFRYFQQVTRTVDDAGMVLAEKSYYSALPARLRSKVTVRIYDDSIEILDVDGSVLRRHEKSKRAGSMTLDAEDRIFNPSRQTDKLLARLAQVGPHAGQLGRLLFETQGRPGHRTLYGLANLPKHFAAADIEAVAKEALASGHHTYSSIKRSLEQRTANQQTAAPQLKQSGEEIRDISEYEEFFENHTNNHRETGT